MHSLFYFIIQFQTLCNIYTDNTDLLMFIICHIYHYQVLISTSFQRCLKRLTLSNKLTTNAPVSQTPNKRSCKRNSNWKLTYVPMIWKDCTKYSWCRVLSQNQQVNMCSLLCFISACTPAHSDQSLRQTHLHRVNKSMPKALL